MNNNRYLKMKITASYFKHAKRKIKKEENLCRLCFTLLHYRVSTYDLTFSPPEFATVFVALLLQDALMAELAPPVSQSDC